MENKLTHFDSNGNAVMVEVSEKNITKRIAIAKGKIYVNDAVMEAVINNKVKKGALLTIYDMCKAIDKTMKISEVHLAKKTGGKSGEFINEK